MMLKLQHLERRHFIHIGVQIKLTHLCFATDLVISMKWVISLLWDIWLHNLIFQFHLCPQDQSYEDLYFSDIEVDELSLDLQTAFASSKNHHYYFLFSIWFYGLHTKYSIRFYQYLVICQRSLDNQVQCKTVIAYVHYILTSLFINYSSKYLKFNMTFTIFNFQDYFFEKKIVLLILSNNGTLVICQFFHLEY